VNLYLYILLVLATAAGYLVLCWRLIKIRGFDPTLITYSDPLAAKKFAGYRLGSGLAIVLSLLHNNLSSYILVVILSSAVMHLLFLSIFNRNKTQPTPYYDAAILISVTLLLYQTPAAYAAAIGLVVFQEVYLIKWRALAGKKYNAWVAASAIKIHRTYRSLSQQMNAEEWFFVLHIATTENIARPPAVRLAERVYYLLRRPAYISTGIMQVRDTHPLSEMQSMRRGAQAVKKVLAEMPKNLTDQQQLTWIAKHYNGSTTYTNYLNATEPGMRMAWRKITKTA